MPGCLVAADDDLPIVGHGRPIRYGNLVQSRRPSPLSAGPKQMGGRAERTGTLL
jgi:hypothetical protein